MGSGLYSAVSGAMSRLQMMDTISDNISNGSTAGFKKGAVSFEAIMERPQRPEDARGIDYAKVKEGFTDFSQGGLTRTGIPLQLAIEGEGFLKVQDANGQLFFTRQGILRREASGNLVTAQGMKVLGEDGKPLSFPGEDVVIDEEGMATFPDGEKVRVPVYEVADVKKLERVGAAFRATPEPVATLMTKPRVFQGYIEDSNVKATQEMARMMEALRVFEACQKMMKNYSELDGKAIELGVM
ncbi:MAG: flagellar hook basal-body protein [Desulfobulbaceae bacterium]|nr:flagellar hook basal-body protein [Desulfobulbaceae bacterium]